MKVSYTFDHHESTAYLEDTRLPDGSFVGINKHTDMPVHLIWSDAENTWVPVCNRTFEFVPPLYETFLETEPRPDCTCVGVSA